MQSINVSKDTVLSLINEGKIRAVRTGKQRYIVSVQSIRDFLDGKKEPCDQNWN
jgi:excisionase family DNA binding protein